MRDLIAILAAFDELRGNDAPAALATVVAVEGSSYRKPGARMLVAGDGRSWGGVSGGCLERDVARRARGVIELGEPALCRYETGADSDLLEQVDTSIDRGEPGMALGCGGAIEILVQRVTNSSPGPLAAIARVVRTGKPEAMLTVFRAGGSVKTPRVGSHIFVNTEPYGDAGIDLALAADLVDARRPTPPICGGT